MIKLALGETILVEAKKSKKKKAKRIKISKNKRKVNKKKAKQVKIRKSELKRKKLTKKHHQQARSKELNKNIQEFLDLTMNIKKNKEEKKLTPKVKFLNGKITEYQNLFDAGDYQEIRKVRKILIKELPKFIKLLKEAKQ